MLRNPTHPALVAGFSTLALAISSTALAEDELLFSLPPGRADITVVEWAHQAGLQVLFDWPLLRARRTRGITGTLQPLDALAAMLRDTPLIFEVVGSHTIVVELGSQYCQPWLSAHLAPLPPCIQMPTERQGATL